MNRRVSRGVVAVFLPVAAGFAGCSQTPTPVSPSQSGSPSAFFLTGTVTNIAGLPVNGAVVEGVDGQGARMSTLADRGGRYDLRIPSAGTLTVRASKEGYVSSERSVDLPQTLRADFILDFTEQSLALSGDYQVVLAADAACVQLPPAVRTRTYDASITPLLVEYYQGELRDEVSRAGSFGVSVEGGLATFAANDSEFYVHERLGASAFLTVFFVASRTPVSTRSFTVPMAGTFEYCADVSPENRFVCRVPVVKCESSNHTFTLTPR